MHTIILLTVNHQIARGFPTIWATKQWYNTKTLPAHIYDRLRQAAEETNQPIERVLIEHLEESFAPSLPTLPLDEQAELDALNHLSNDALLTIAHEQIQENRQTRMEVLMERNNMGTISTDERTELTLLIEQGQQLMLRKAKALALLTERGHSIDLAPLDGQQATG